MRNNRLFLGLTPIGLNLLSFGSTVVLICLGIRIARASDIALRVANSQLITGSSARRLEALADKLEEQAKVIEQKDKAYQELEAVYKNSLKGKRGYDKLQDAIEAVKVLPTPSNITEIKTEISATEEVLQETLDSE